MRLGAMGSRGGFGSSGVLGRVGYQWANSEAQAVAAAFTTPPTNARKKLIDDLVGALKTAGIWANLDLLYVMAAADAQAARVNWISPGTFTATAVNSPSFTADRGFTGDGASSRLRTSYTPSVNGSKFALNSASLWVWSLTQQQSSARDIGSSNADQSCIRIRSTSDANFVTVNDQASTNQTNPTSVGFFGGQRVSSATKRSWGNGAQIGVDQAVASTALPTQEQWICGANSAAFSTRQEAAAAWGASLSGLESAFYNALLTYMQAVGAA